MHDFHFAEQIVKIVLDYTKKHRLKSVSKISLELGKIIEHNEPIKTENLKFNINLLTKGTPAEKAKIEIKKINGNKWCLKEIEGE